VSLREDSGVGRFLFTNLSSGIVFRVKLYAPIVQQKKNEEPNSSQNRSSSMSGRSVFEKGVTMATSFDLSKEDIPRLNQCFLCKSWHLETDLHSIEVPDQAGYVKKLACQECLKEIMAGSSLQDAPGQAIS
jgi:hypothetical protein